MIPLGLSAAEQAAFHRALTTSHEIRTRVSLLDMEERHLGSLTQRLLGGQVDIVADEDVTRSASVTLLDPTRSLGLDSGTPGAAVHLDRMLSITRGVWVDEISDWVDVPVFRGPAVATDRDGDTISVDCLGKEHLLRSDGGWTRTFRAGTRRTTVIREILENSGEARMVIPEWKPELGDSTGIPKFGPGSDPWPWVKRLAESMHAQAWFDGAGVFRLRLAPTRVSWTFRDAHLLSTPKTAVSDREVYNTVWVKGRAPKGRSWAVEARISLPAWHHNSPEALGRRGVPRYLTLVVEDESIHTEKAAFALANRKLKEIAVEDFSAEFSALPVPHLDPLDLCTLATEQLTGGFRVKKATIPLTHEEGMTVGYTRRFDNRYRLRSRRPPRRHVPSKGRATMGGVVA